MEPKRFFELLAIINDAIEELKGLKVAIKDFENQDWRLKDIQYDSDKDQVYFKCEEDE